MNEINEINEIMEKIGLKYSCIYIIKGEDGEIIRDEINDGEKVKYISIAYRAAQAGYNIEGEMEVYPNEKEVKMIDKPIVSSFVDFEEEEEIISEFIMDMKGKFKEHGYVLSGPV